MQGYGVGFAKLQAMLKQSEWFLQHGTLTGLKTTTYHPGKNIEILVGAKMEHFIGRDIFCMTGDTLIKTENGYKRLDNLAKSDGVRVYAVENHAQKLNIDKCNVVKTKEVSELYEIELEDGTILRCTGEHKLMLASGEYKEVQYLTTDDELAEVSNN